KRRLELPITCENSADALRLNGEGDVGAANGFAPKKSREADAENGDNRGDAEVRSPARLEQGEQLGVAVDLFEIGFEIGGRRGQRLGDNGVQLLLAQSLQKLARGFHKEGNSRKSLRVGHSSLLCAFAATSTQARPAMPLSRMLTDWPASTLRVEASCQAANREQRPWLWRDQRHLMRSASKEER